MYRNILVALDGSTHGQAALDLAVYLARRLNAQLHGVHVLDTRLLRGSFLHDFSGSLGLEQQFHLTSRLENFLQGIADSLLKAFEERCTAEGLRFRKSVVTGDVAELLARAADMQDLVVMGSRGTTYDANPRAESTPGTARQLMRLSPTPLILTGASWKPVNRVVVAYDGSVGSHRALAEAARLGELLELEITLVHVVEPGGTETPDPLEEARQYLEPYRVDVQYETRHGGRLTELSALGGAAGCDLLFVGYQGSSWLKELFVGHAPEMLINRVSCPIWVAK